MDAGDWRTQLPPDSRQRVVNRIMDILTTHRPEFSPENLIELRNIAVRFEERIFTAANSQSDYIRRISLRMLTRENRPQNTMPNGGTNGEAAVRMPTMENRPQNTMPNGGTNGEAADPGNND